MKPIQELLAQPSEDFAEHLKLSDNHRIIFSGMYGIGKTTFLKHFFSKENDKGFKYNTVHLFPVNYQVSDNKDIFEYIKYDIIAHLLSVKEIEFERNDILAFQTIPYLLLQRPGEVLAPLLQFFGEVAKSTGGIGKVVGTAASELGKLSNAYKKLIEEVYKQHQEMKYDEQKSLLDFLEKAQYQKGSIYENDFYTELISKLLQKWKDSTGEQESVLIIDDLDRIDPQHAFRLFNIFSAHFDYGDEQLDYGDEQQNKFGFDKVIFVCDIENIRNIFTSNYGADVDFGGYIDKFYSKEVYRFDNLKSLEKVAKKWISDLLLKDYSLDDEYRKNLKIHLSTIIVIMIKTSAVNLRSLTKLCNTIPNYYADDRQFITALFHILIFLTGSSADLMIAFRKCEEYDHTYQSLRNGGVKDEMLDSVLAFIGRKNNRNNDSSQKDEIIEEYGLQIKYTLSEHRIYDKWVDNVEKYDLEGKSSDKYPNIFFVYQKALRLLVSR